MTRSIQLIVWICFVISIGSQRAILTISCLKQLNGIVRISTIFAIWFSRVTAKDLADGQVRYRAALAISGDWRPDNHRQVKSQAWRNP